MKDMMLEAQLDICSQVLLYNKERKHVPLACVVTLGCQQNESDSEKLCGFLTKMGYGFTDDPHKADFILYNTCAVRENAELKVQGKIGALSHIKRANPDLVLAVCGCMMQQEDVAKDFKRKFPFVDLIFGTHALNRFPELLYSVLTRREKVLDITSEESLVSGEMPAARKSDTKALVSVMYGCNNFCSYCIVPYVRGRERSRRPQDIMAEIENLARQGYSEIMLLGQNVNSYGKDLGEGDLCFAELLEKADAVPGIRRIRFMTSHPKDLSDALIDAIANLKNVCNQLHLPVQSGSDRILKLMNRGYTKEEYLEKIEKVKNKCPGIALTSDIIVGFPGETSEDFQETLDLVSRVEFDSLFTFLYSKRGGTPAANMPDEIPAAEKSVHFNQLVALQNDISRKKNEAYVGMTCAVLIEGVSRTNPDMLTGRTETGKIVNFAGDLGLMGKYIDVKITEANTWSLLGHATI